MTVQRKQDFHDLATLARLDETEVRCLWHFAWFDGPLHGMAEYRGSRAWYDYHSDTEDECNYRYVLYTLTQQQIETADLWHATQGNWDAATQRWVGRDSEKHDESWTGPDFTGVTPIEWFTDGRNEDFYAVKVLR